MPVLAASVNEHLVTMGVPVLEKVARTAAVYFALVLLLRFVGRRTLAQLNPFDLVVLLLLSNVVQNAIIGNDNSLLGGLIGAFTLVALNETVVWFARKHHRVDAVLEGRGRVLVEDGRFDEHAIHRVGLTDAAIDEQIEASGAASVQDVEKMVLLPWGKFEILLAERAQSATKGDLARLEDHLVALRAAIEQRPR